MNNVIPFKVKPKTVNRTYKQCHYTVTFTPGAPKEQQWKWEVELVQTTKFGGTASTQVKAFRAAEKHIDSVKRNQGVG